MENSKGAKQEFTSMKDKTVRNNPTELGEKRRQVPQGMYEHVKLMEFGGGWVGVLYCFHYLYLPSAFHQTFPFLLWGLTSDFLKQHD